VAVGVLNEAVARLSLTIPAFRWAFAGSPLGVSLIVLDGRVSSGFPTRLSTALVVSALACIIAVPLVLAGREVGRVERTRRSRPTRRLAAGLLALSIPVGAATGPLLAAVVPWRLSPQWFIDVLNHNTPDVAVDRLIADAAAGKPRAVDILGPLAEVVRSTPGIEATTEMNSPRAGTVNVEWPGPSRSGGFTACVTRGSRGWRVVEVRRNGLCP
jgi:hypothetical protein